MKLSISFFSEHCEMDLASFKQSLCEVHTRFISNDTFTLHRTLGMIAVLISFAALRD
jgi:hypothetical protein